MLVGSGPRFARDAFGPVLAFYIGWELVGLWAGMALAVVVSISAYLYERRRERPGVMARISLAVIAIQVAVGAISQGAEGFLAPPVILNGIYGVAFLGSVAIGRPLAGVFANEMYPFPDEVRGSATFRRTFGRVSLVWGTYLVVRSIARFWVLTNADVGAFVLFNLLTGFPLMSLLMSWSVWFGLRSFRRSDEWGWAFAGDTVPIDPV
ncbi:VC0807 family protein [Aquihabitans daechungensis]|uniref:VC0807 family protein n=1 Tax=Aquihabitans daechungensis TaxID=1052257 RepID=UPI003B9DCB33